MKYIVICSIAMIVCFGIGFLASYFIFRKRKHPKTKIAVSTVISGICLFAVLTLIYLSIYYPAGETAAEALKGTETVSVTKIEGGYMFDGPGEECALVFYGGAKVEYKAYAPLMLEMAEKGIDCFLAELPFNFALLGGDSADKFINNYTYETWIMAGHSMGGIMAAKYANKHEGKIDGVILLASYSTEKINESVQTLSIYGSNDGCLDKTEYETDRENWSPQSTELVIQGGNHGNFGDYGEQSGDGNAEISAEEQQRRTAEAVCNMFIK